MFSGIVTKLGIIEEREVREGGSRLVIGAEGWCEGIAVGSSVCCGGVCLTATDIQGGKFAVDVSTETLRRTTIVVWEEGREINLERSLRLGDEVGGHLVYGHVDERGIVSNVYKEGNSVVLSIRVSGGLVRKICSKGSIAIDGVSLTVNEIEGEEIRMTLVPYTLGVTSLGSLLEGMEVNVETDMLGRYVERMLSGVV